MLISVNLIIGKEANVKTKKDYTITTEDDLLRLGYRLIEEGVYTKDNGDRYVFIYWKEDQLLKIKQVMIKDGELTNRAELIQQGWEFSHEFGLHTEVWRKEDKRCMWNTKSQKIILVYNSEDRYATKGY